jgi:DNA-directed RNA polymerase subunit RPC12/RpoP
MQCTDCGKKFHGSGLSVTLEGKQKMLCADCYGKLKEEYKKKKNCEDCNHFHDNFCRMTERKLKPVSIGINDFFVQAENCTYYTDEEIDTEKGKEMTALNVDVNNLIKQLADKGQTLTYHCCHCGAPLKIGKETSEVLRSCPNCGYSLEIINMAKLIKQHL